LQDKDVKQKKEHCSCGPLRRSSTSWRESKLRVANSSLLMYYCWDTAKPRYAT